jgi:hypothetical protein
LVNEKVTMVITRGINVILAGASDAEKDALRHLVKARGVPLAKAGKGIRPIAVNEVFMNLVARLALSKTRDKIMAGLHPADLGFSRPGGTEAAIHSVNCLYKCAAKSNTDFVLLQSDFTNAYNTVRRDAVFAAIEEVCPELIPLLMFRYDGMVVEFFDKMGFPFSIESQTGVSQGCPLSPAIFQVTMSKVLRSLRERWPTVFSFLDDNNGIMPSVSDAKLALELLEAEAAKIGLALNWMKCALFWHRADPHDQSPYAMQELATCQALMEKGLKVSHDGASVLGAFIGTELFVSEGVTRSFGEMADRVQRVRDFISFTKSEAVLARGKKWTQKLLKLIRFSTCALPNYTLRTIHPRLTSTHAVAFDRLVAMCVMEMCMSVPDWIAPEVNDFISFLSDPSQPTELSECALERVFLKGPGLGLSDRLSPIQFARTWGP